MGEAFITRRGGGGKKMPDGYTTLPYIELSGTQYIDTGFIPNQDSRIVMDAYIESKSTATGIFGSRTAAKQNGFCAFLNADKGIQSDYGTTQETSANSGITIEKGRYIFDKNKNVMSVDGTAIHTSTYTTFSGEYSIYLGCINQAGAITKEEHIMIGKIYSCQIYDNDVLVRDYIPCANPDGIIGLYDKKTRQFYGNIGTGVFESNIDIHVDGFRRLIVNDDAIPITGSYATDTYIDLDFGVKVGYGDYGITVVMKNTGGTTSYENLAFELGSKPDGVSLVTTKLVNHGTAGMAGGLYCCIIQGLTVESTIAISANSRDGTDDYTLCKIDITPVANTTG